MVKTRARASSERREVEALGGHGRLEADGREGGHRGDEGGDEDLAHRLPPGDGRHRRHHGVHAADHARQHGGAGGQHPAADEQAGDAEGEGEARPRPGRDRRCGSRGATTATSTTATAPAPSSQPGSAPNRLDRRPWPRIPVIAEHARAAAPSSEHDEPDEQQRPCAGPRASSAAGGRPGAVDGSGVAAAGGRRDAAPAPRRRLRPARASAARRSREGGRSAARLPRGTRGGCRRWGKTRRRGYSRRLARDGLVRRASREVGAVEGDLEARLRRRPRSPSSSPIGPTTAECPQ